MTPEEVFGGTTADEWAIGLSRSLVRWKDWVERTLNENGTYSAFCERISAWWRVYLEKDSDAVEPAARELFGICDQFGLIRLMMSKGYVVSVRVRRPVLGSSEAVRTRGATRRRCTSASTELARVAGLFGR